MTEYIEVTAAAVVLPTLDKRESYFYRGAIVPVDGFTEAGLEHARVQGLITEPFEIEVVAVEEPAVVLTQADIDAAVQAAVAATRAEIGATQAADVTLADGSKPPTDDAGIPVLPVAPTEPAKKAAPKPPAAK